MDNLSGKGKVRFYDNGRLIKLLYIDSGCGLEVMGKLLWEYLKIRENNITALIAEKFVEFLKNKGISWVYILTGVDERIPSGYGGDVIEWQYNVNMNNTGKTIDVEGNDIRCYSLGVDGFGAWIDNFFKSKLVNDELNSEVIVDEDNDTESISSSCSRSQPGTHSVISYITSGDGDDTASNVSDANSVNSINSNEGRWSSEYPERDVRPLGENKELIIVSSEASVSKVGNGNDGLINLGSLMLGMILGATAIVAIGHWKGIYKDVT